MFKEIIPKYMHKILKSDGKIYFPYLDCVQDALKLYEKEIEGKFNIKIVHQNCNPLFLSTKLLIEKGSVIREDEVKGAHSPNSAFLQLTKF